MRLNKKKGIRKIICDMNPEVLVDNDNVEVTDSFFNFSKIPKICFYFRGAVSEMYVNATSISQLLLR